MAGVQVAAVAEKTVPSAPPAIARTQPYNGSANLVHWKPGQSGNPKGRPKGSRNKLAETFFDDLYADWCEADNAKAVLAAARIEKPADYLRIIASLMPKELTIA